MRKAFLAIALALATTVPALASVPSVADLDAQSRASGNRREIAVIVGRSLFRTEWPAQIFKVEANGLDGHLVLGVGLYGVKFHEPITREAFLGEVRQLVERSFDAAPDAEEIDLWVVVPIPVPKGAIVSGDLALPTTKTVFTVSVRRDAALDLQHLLDGPNVYWDEEWSRTAFKSSSNR